MTLDASGDLGLGLTPNTWGAGQIAFEFGSLGTLVSTGSTVSLQNNSYNNGTNNIRKVIGEASSYSQSGGAHIWQYAASGASGSTISFSEAMRISSSGNVSIGNTNNSVKLDVSGDVRSTTKYAWGSATNGTTGQIATDNTNNYFDYLGALIFRTAAASSEKMRLNASGNLGLGVTPSAWGNIFTALQIKNTSLSAVNGIVSVLGGNSYYNGTSYTYIQNGYANQLEVNNSGSFLFQIAPSGTAGNAISFTQAMTLDASGNLGVGITNPTAKIHLETSGSSALRMVRSGTPATNFGFEFGNGEIGLYDYTNSAYRWYITSAGNVGIGTSSPNSISGYTIVDIQNTSNGGLIQLGTNGTGYGQLYNNTGEVQLRTIASIPLVFGTNSSERMRITSGGEVYIAGTADQGAYNLQVNGTGVWGAGAYVNGSDSSLKENIQNMGSALELVNQLQPKTYTYKPSYSKDTTIQVGFIAQDLEQVLGTQIYKNSIVVDGPNFKSVAYQNLIPLLVQSIKELKAEIETLKNK
jgi:hypothetical protein